ncbi:MAG TPA: 50S ribosomal protein L25, partial [Candidatus Polarisedimenticolia bacterium]|nr:50S ribosomal protein L25 [Candidatus Polarisedimenticolia bacterium]
DFLRIGEHTKVTVGIPVRFDNEDDSPGLKRGGVLNVVQHELELICDAAEIPDDVTIDLSGYDVGATIHLKDITLPQGAKSAIEDPDLTIATIIASTALKSQEGDTATEGEGA